MTAVLEQPASIWDELTRDHLHASVMVAQGLPYPQVVRAFKDDLGVGEDELLRVTGISRRTLERRRSGGRFSEAESERIWRYFHLLSLARDLFDDDLSGAIRWMGLPKPALGGKAPRDLVGSAPAAEAVEELIVALEHGMFS